MKGFIKFSLSAIIVAVLAVYGSINLEAKVEYTKKEGKACTVCHVKANSKELNDVGKCYEKNKSLKTCITDDKDKPAKPK